MTNYKLSLQGAGTKGSSIKASLLSSLVQTVVDGAKAAVRLRVDGRSVVPGTTPAWVDRVCDFDVTGIAQGSTVLEFDCPPLHELEPDRFAQQNLFDNVPGCATALGFFCDGLRDAADGKEDSDNFDDGLLGIYSRLAEVYVYGIDQMSFSNGDKRTGNIELLPKTMETIKMLCKETPSPQAVRLFGKVDSIRASDKMFELILKTGERLRAIAPPDTNHEQMKDVFGQYAVTSGKAEFRPNGTVLRIECTNISKSDDKSQDLFSVMPKARSHRLFIKDLHVPQTADNGLNKIWGRWPGTETDEEVQQALYQ